MVSHGSAFKRVYCSIATFCSSCFSVCMNGISNSTCHALLYFSNIPLCTSSSVSLGMSSCNACAFALPCVSGVPTPSHNVMSAARPSADEYYSSSIAESCSSAVNVTARIDCDNDSQAWLVRACHLSNAEASSASAAGLSVLCFVKSS